MLLRFRSNSHLHMILELELNCIYLLGTNQLDFMFKQGKSTSISFYRSYMGVRRN